MKSTNKIAWFCFVCLFVFFTHMEKAFSFVLIIISLYELETLPWWKVAQRLNFKEGGGGGGGIGDT